MIFRDPVEQGPERKMDTPNPHVLDQKWTNFKENRMFYDSTPILNKAAMTNIESKVTCHQRMLVKHQARKRNKLQGGTVQKHQ